MFLPAHLSNTACLVGNAQPASTDAATSIETASLFIISVPKNSVRNHTASLAAHNGLSTSYPLLLQSATFLRNMRAGQETASHGADALGYAGLHAPKKQVRKNGFHIRGTRKGGTGRGGGLATGGTGGLNAVCMCTLAPMA